jgi:hypothetical protein
LHERRSRGPRVRAAIEQDTLYQILEAIQHIQNAAVGHKFRFNGRFSKIFAERAFFQAREVEAMNVL